MILNRPRPGDRKDRISWCLWPCFTNEHVFWFQKVTKTYERRRLHGSVASYCWELVEVKAKLSKGE